MRYRDGELPDPLYPHSESVHIMLTFSSLLALAIGIVLLWLGRHGKIMWLTWWSGGLIVCALGYLLYDLWRLLSQG